MRKVVPVTTLLAGALLVVVPRFVLPACEYRGFPRMHCSDTARAEMLIGALLLAAGALALGTSRSGLAAGSAVASCALLALAWLMPRVYGYCPSPKMPCHYGMVPSIRFIVGAGALILVPGAVLLARAAWARPGARPEAS